MNASPSFDRSPPLLLLVCALALATAPAARARPSPHASPEPRHAVLGVDPRENARVHAIFGARAGAAIVYDVVRDRIVSVVHPPFAFSVVHPPGSLMKLVTAFALLEHGLVSDADVVDCTNHLTIRGNSYTCAVKGGHGRVNLHEAIVRSCCSFFYTIGQRLPPRLWLAAARELGLGAPSPFPGGVRAQVHLPRSPRDRTLMLVGEGPAVRITPWDALHLVVRLRRLARTNSAAAFVYAAMRDVVERGTGQAARIRGVDVRGKTGTSAWLHSSEHPHPTHGWFAATARNLAVVVYVERGTGDDAALLAGRILRALLDPPPPHAPRTPHGGEKD